MNALLTLVARELVQHALSHPDADLASLCDVAILFLAQQRVSPAALRGLLPAVRRELRAGRKIVPAQLMTPAGHAGPAAETILASLERTLGASVELAEIADNTLIGGGIVAVGDERLDLSIRGALHQLEAALRS